MNVIKFRPVGRPSAPIILVRVSQSKAAIYPRRSKNGQIMRPDSISVAAANREMLRRGFTRAGVRHG